MFLVSATTSLRRKALGEGLWDHHSGSWWLGAIKICCIKRGESIVFIGICLYCQKYTIKDKPKANEKDCIENEETGYREGKSQNETPWMSNF